MKVKIILPLGFRLLGTMDDFVCYQAHVLKTWPQPVAGEAEPSESQAKGNSMPGTWAPTSAFFLSASQCACDERLCSSCPHTTMHCGIMDEVQQPQAIKDPNL